MKYHSDIYKALQKELSNLIKIEFDNPVENKVVYLMHKAFNKIIPTYLSELVLIDTANLEAALSKLSIDINWDYISTPNGIWDSGFLVKNNSHQNFSYKSTSAGIAFDLQQIVWALLDLNLIVQVDRINQILKFGSDSNNLETLLFIIIKE